MQRSQKRLIALMAGLVIFVIGAALLYQIGMSALEGKPRTFWDSIEWAAETLSTTGYGRDVRWASPVMVLFVVGVQFVGVFLFFLIVPVVLLPYLEERFEERLPRRADSGLTDHIIVYRFGPAVETLLQRLKTRSIPTLVVETDEVSARAVAESGQDVVFVRTEEDVLDSIRLSEARAIVANGRDEENAALILRARQMGFKGDIYAFVEEPAHRRPMELAGATAAYTPRHIIAAALAAHASDQISPRLPGLEQLPGWDRREIRVPNASPVAGVSVRAAALGVAVVGQWHRSQLNVHCVPETVIEPGAVLEVVGEPQALARAADRIGAAFFHNSGAFLIGGFGEVGRKVHELLTDVGEEVRVIERHAGPGVDVVGNVLDPSVLMRGGIESARALVLALDSDDATLFATVIARDTVEDVPVIARVNHARNLANMHRAGADFALSISDISGEMLSARLLGRQARAREERRRIEAVEGRHYAGRTIGELSMCIVALRRGDEILPAMHDGLIEAEDGLWIVAT
ncbi:MAG: NAD-binding protein [Acidobacteriota bacterium]